MAEDEPGLRRLPLRCVPEADESLSGFVARLAERNGMDRLSEITRPAGIHALPAFVPSPREVRALATLSGVASERLEAMCGVGTFGPWPDTTTTLRGIKVPVVWFFSGRRVCPRCLAESPHHRIPWDLVYVRGCVRHGCALVHACPGCSGRLDWKRPSLRRCRCGYDLAAAPAADWPADHARAAKWVWDPVHGFGHRPPRMLEAVPFAKAVELAGTTGEMMLAVRNGAAAFPLGVDGDGCLAAGYAALDGDADRLEAAVRAALAKPTRLRTLGALDRLGRCCATVEGAGFVTALAETVMAEVRSVADAGGTVAGRGLLAP